MTGESFLTQLDDRFADEFDLATDLARDLRDDPTATVEARERATKLIASLVRMGGLVLNDRRLMSFRKEAP